MSLDFLEGKIRVGNLLLQFLVESRSHLSMRIVLWLNKLIRSSDRIIEPNGLISGGRNQKLRLSKIANVNNGRSMS
jgi:hypothetical protein